MRNPGMNKLGWMGCFVGALVFVLPWVSQAEGLHQGTDDLQLEANDFQDEVDGLAREMDETKHGDSWLEALSFGYTGEGFWNTRGGMVSGNRGDYRADASVMLEREWGARGGSIFLHLQEQHGSGITESLVGDFQTLSNIDADDLLQVSELWYRQDFWDGGLWLKIGKQDSTGDFVAPELGGEFINSSPGFAPTVPMVTYPDPDLGLVVGFRGSSWFSFQMGVYQGRPDARRSLWRAIKSLKKRMALVEPALDLSLGGLQGRVRLGAWHHSDSWKNVSPLSSQSFPDNYGLYLVWDQSLTAQEGSNSGIFFQMGWAPPDRNEVQTYLGGGLQWSGPLRGRSQDVLGFGVFHANFSRAAGFVDQGETASELYYKIQVADWLSEKIDIQHIANPGGAGYASALVLGIRTEAAF